MRRRGILLRVAVLERLVLIHRSQFEVSIIYCSDNIGIPTQTKPQNNKLEKYPLDSHMYNFNY